MQTLQKEVYMELKAMAKERGVTVQEFLRSEVVHHWMRDNGSENKTGSKFRTR